MVTNHRPGSTNDTDYIRNGNKKMVQRSTDNANLLELTALPLRDELRPSDMFVEIDNRRTVQHKSNKIMMLDADKSSRNSINTHGSPYKSNHPHALRDIAGTESTNTFQKRIQI